MKTHICVGGAESSDPSYEVLDGNGLYLCRACSRCEREKLRGFRPEVLRPYSQNDVDEEIDGEFDPRDWLDG